MAGRRKKWLVAATLLAVVAALACALLGRRGKMEVQLLFAGYTNYVGTFTNPAPQVIVLVATNSRKGYTNYVGSLTNPAPQGSALARHVFSALVLATNSGNVTIELADTLRAETTGWQTSFEREWMNNVALPIRMDRSGVLKPGETALVEFEIQSLGVPWSADLLVRRRGLLDRLYVKALTTGGATGRRTIGKWLAPPTEVWATLKMTNAPLDKNSLRECIEPYRPRQVVR